MTKPRDDKPCDADKSPRPTSHTLEKRMANGNWFKVAMVAIGIVVGSAGSGGVAAMKYSQLKAEVDAVKVEQADRLARIETDVQWIRKQMERMLIAQLENN